MATNVQTGALLKATWDSDVEIVDTTSGSDPGFDLAAGTYMGFCFLAEEFTVAAPDAFVLAQWSVAGNSTEGELVFTITTLPDRNGGKIYKFQYSVNSGSDWSDLPAGTTTGTYTATGVTGGTYTSTIMLRMVTSAGDGGNSDAKTATVAGGSTNLVTNPGFDTGTAWTLDHASVQITGGKLVFTSSTSYAEQTIVAGEQPAGTYNWSFDLSGYSEGTIRIQLRNNTTSVATISNQTSDGAKSGTISPASVFNNIRIITNGTTTASVDNIVLEPQ